MIQARDIQLIDPKLLKYHSKNRNKHTPEQIDRLIKLIGYQGFRAPIVVSNRSGEVIAGNGRLEAALKMALPKVPVSFQDFEDEDQEIAYGISDNAVASWAELDLQNIKMDAESMLEGFDFDLFGIKGFNIDIPEFDAGSEDDQGQLDEKQFVFMECPHCGERFEKGQARIVKD